ncbi:hypothetical protein B0H13DRAFT_2369999 [Mycena leptocephala]|nr:hypothetical protein B0H13DRAFT_2369999 [Mycena leptocephala]
MSPNNCLVLVLYMPVWKPLSTFPKFARAPPNADPYDEEVPELLPMSDSDDDELEKDGPIPGCSSFQLVSIDGSFKIGRKIKTPPLAVPERPFADLQHGEVLNWDHLFLMQPDAALTSSVSYSATCRWVCRCACHKVPSARFSRNFDF